MHRSIFTLRSSNESACRSCSLWEYCSADKPYSFFVNLLCTDSIKSISDFRNGLHKLEQYSRIGLTETVKALNRIALFFDLKQFKIMEALRLALLHISLM